MPKTRGFRSHTLKIFLQSPVFTRLYQIKKKKKKQPKNILMCVSLPMKNEHLHHEKHEIDETHTIVIVLTHIYTHNTCNFKMLSVTVAHIDLNVSIRIHVFDTWALY